MPIYTATKNLVFSSLDKEVIVGETIELDKDYADKVNENLKLTFPDVSAVLVPVDEVLQEKPPKKSPRNKKVEAAPEVAEDGETE
ncbi:hypothetical protein [Streptococcus himalayensis]|uniref:Uncharacterized protein n=1 Tax=Streptococcus himalayensis TaxID=1888195 RepID=A0A917A5I4_9STRE|nr:hypothetical protein [Streptococcus himalayensis]QBX25372.1 hypothetical protein Javan254_0017 [Streptococcus phage Javan254]GGE26318.1 hypothetical protein GCM10011510_04360 [Streptococcus himalayensis]